MRVRAALLMSRGFFGKRLRVTGNCVHRLFSTVCARRRAERDSAQSSVVVSGWSFSRWWDLKMGRQVGNWGWGFPRWWDLEMGRRGFPSWRDESQSRTVNVSRFFGMRLRVFGSCVHRLFSTVCARRRAERDSAQSRVVVLWPPRHSTVEAIVVTILCECICFSIPSFTAFCKGHGLSCHHT